MGRKITKKIAKVFLWVVVMFIALDFFIVSLFFVPFFQSTVVDGVMRMLSNKWGSEISIGSIYITPTLGIIAKDLVIKDFKNNDMIKIDHIKTKLKYIETLRFKLAFRELYIDGALVNLQKYKGADRVNIGIWAQNLKKKDKTQKSPFTLKVDRLIMKESIFRFVNDSLRLTKENNDIDYAYFELKDIDFHATDFTINNDDISAKITRLAFQQYTGFELLNASGNFRINSKNLIFNNCVMVTRNSRLFLDFSFIYDGFDSYGDFKNRINFYVKARPSTLNLKDLACFVPSLKGMNNSLVFSCLAKGSLTSMNFRDLALNYGSDTYLKGKLSIVNLVNFKNAFFNLNIKESNINPAELAFFSLPGGKKIEIPKAISNFGQVQVNGFFKGSFTRFVTDIEMYSNLGYASGNLSVSDNVDFLLYEGSLASNQFNLGRLINQTQNFGLISFNAKVNGSVSRKQAFAESLKANIQGKVNHFDIRGYPVRDIDLSGFYTSKKYNGKIVCKDTNAAFTFDGSADFSGKIPNIQTFVTIDRFAPGKMFEKQAFPADTASSNAFDNFLAYVQKHPDLNLKIDSLNLRINGNDLEDINGIVFLNGLNYGQDGKSLELNRLRLTALKSQDVHKYILTSDNLNASLSTTYQIKSIIDSVVSVGYQYLPNILPQKKEEILVRNGVKTDSASQNQYLSLNVEIFDINPIISMFLPKISFAPNASLSFYIDSKKDNDSIAVNFPAITIRDSLGNGKFKVSHLSITGNEETKHSFKIQLKSDTFAIIRPQNEDLLFKDIYLVSTIDNNLIDYNLIWSNPEMISTQASQLSGMINTGNRKDIIAKVTKSSIFLKNYEWKFDTAHTIHMRGNEFDFNQVKIAARQSKINLNGTFSKKSTDSLVIDLMNVDLTQLNPYLETRKMSLAGDISSKIRLFYRNSHRVLLGRLFISDFVFNEEYFGNIFLGAAIPATGNIRLRGGIFRSAEKINSNIVEIFNYDSFNNQKNKVANLDGSFSISNKTLAINANIDSLRIGFLTPFLASFSQYVDGQASGRLSFISKPDSTYFNGAIDIKDAALGIKALNTVYRMENQTIEFTNNGFNFNKITLSDKFNNTASLNGYVHHRNFKEFNIDLTVETNKILALNTLKSSGMPFYGDGFVSGKIHILGDTKKLSFVGNNIRTERDSRLFLPLTFEDQVKDSEVITFKIDTTQIKKQVKDSVEMATMDMDFDFTFNVTPDLAVQIELDPSIGGTLQGVTEGTLRIIYSTNSDLELIGSLTLRSGSFSMAFKDILNKKFSLSPGGTINFSGPINNATIGISAIYKTTASLADLLADNTTTSNRRVPVNSYINLTGNLMSPDIGFSFDLPNSTPDLKAKVYSAIDTTNTQNNVKQFFSLVMLGKFESPNGDGTNTLISGAEYSGIELLTNTFNNFISQQLKNVDIGVNYRNRDANHSEEYSVYASTSFYNDRIIIEGNFGYVNDPSGDYGNANNFIGDGSIEYLLNEAGNWRVKVFNVTNQYYSLTGTSQYAQGVALIYKQEFNNSKDILETFKRKKRKKKEEESKQTPITPNDPRKNEQQKKQ